MDLILKIIIFVALSIIILSVVERQITKSLFRQQYSLDKTQYIKIMVPDVPLPCYVYYDKTCTKCKDDIPDKLKPIYEKHHIPSHISATLRKRLNDAKVSAQSIMTSGIPINSIVKTISNGMTVINEADPTHSNEVTGWKILQPKGYAVNCFVDKRKLYIM